MLVHEDVLWTHAKITNPNPVDIKGYWWTCVAMPVTDKDRVITPSELSVTPCTAWPYGAHTLDNTTFRGPDIDSCSAANGGEGACAWQQDMSYLGNIPVRKPALLAPASTGAARLAPWTRHWLLRLFYVGVQVSASNPLAAWTNTHLRHNGVFIGLSFNHHLTPYCHHNTDGPAHDNPVVTAHDFFVRIEKPQLPYIAHAREDGYTVIHSHPLNGTKFFTWGMAGFG